MIQNMPNHAPPGAHVSGTGSAATAGNWLSGSARSAASAIGKLSIPNPAHYIFSAPGKAFTLLTLFARGVAGVTVPNTYQDSWPQPIALPGMPQPPEPEWMTALDYPNQDEELAREKRSPRGRGGSARGGGRSSSSRGGSRSRSSGSRSRSSGSRSRSGGSRSRGSSSGNGWHNGRLIIAGLVARETGRTIKSGNKVYKEYTTSKQSYYVGKADYELTGRRVNLHKLLMVTESGQRKAHITSSRGKQYKIIPSGNWQKINVGTGNNRITISTLPKVREHTIANTLFRMAMFNIFFNHYMHNPVHVHFLFHSGRPRTLSCVPNPDCKNIDIGYYDDGLVQPTTESNSTATAASNYTTTPGLSGNSTQAPDRKFIKLASAPLGSSIKFAVLDNPDPKANKNSTPTPAGVTNSTTSIPAFAGATNSTAQPANATVPATVSSSPALAPQNSTDIETSNNITQIDSLLARQGVADNVMSQLAIMNGDDVLKIISLDRRVKQLLFDSDNDTILNYPMIGPKTVVEKHTWLWKEYSNAGVKNTGSPLLPVVTALSALKRYIL